LIWNPDLEKWQNTIYPLDDGFRLYCTGYNTAGSQLLSAYAKSPLIVERIVELTGGEFSPAVKWYQPDKLITARISTDEIVQRITVTQDPESSTARNESMSRVEALADLIGSIPFKPPLEDLNAGFKFTWSDQYRYCNVQSVGTDPEPATIIYAGVGKRQDQLASLFAKVRAFASNSENPDRFAVVYQEGTHVKLYSPQVPNSIARPVPLGNSFTEPEK
jgi:hypothetical protein